MKPRILICGATGNVGRAVIRHLDPGRVDLVITCRDERRTRQTLAGIEADYLALDLEGSGVCPALGELKGAFIMRPPQIGTVTPAFASFLGRMKESGSRDHVFLSVQGAESRAYLPHAKIEKAIRRIGLPCAFLRPGYFMENLITTLREEVVVRRRLSLPSGRYRFNWIAVDDIGKAAAKLLQDGLPDPACAFTLTGRENLAMVDVALRLTTRLGLPWAYEDPGPLRYAWRTWSESGKISLVGVMLLLHWLPRFGKDPMISGDLERLTGEPPTSLDAWIEANRAALVGHAGG